MSFLFVKKSIFILPIKMQWTEMLNNVDLFIYQSFIQYSLILMCQNIIFFAINTVA